MGHGAREGQWNPGKGQDITDPWTRDHDILAEWIKDHGTGILVQWILDNGHGILEVWTSDLATPHRWIKHNSRGFQVQQIKVLVPWSRGSGHGTLVQWIRDQDQGSLDQWIKARGHDTQAHRVQGEELPIQGKGRIADGVDSLGREIIVGPKIRMIKRRIRSQTSLKRSKSQLLRRNQNLHLACQRG
ncbi:Hypp9472 [Branchiostoma lanceolatum]|uniref:Hypp9472 protein n=1 Tax=Branchiostoma lanceolatum TaxID=7740 RepID=A0A8S4MN69_BRALA|nr:Hypp9472 [Branchiostoma lanceolatum]